MGLWHLEAQAQRTHARHQLGSHAADRVVLTPRPVEYPVGPCKLGPEVYFGSSFTTCLLAFIGLHMLTFVKLHLQFFFYAEACQNQVRLITDCWYMTWQPGLSNVIWGLSAVEYRDMCLGRI